MKFKLYFDELTGVFKDLLRELKQINNEEKKEKYKVAVSRLINKMSEKL